MLRKSVRRFFACLVSLSMILLSVCFGPVTYAPPRKLSAKDKASASKRSCSPCSLGAQQSTPEDQTLASLEELAVLGRRTQPAPLLTTVRTAFEGARVNFVSTARGDLAFSIIDLQIQGAMPLFFQRVYTSDGEDWGM